MDIDPSYCGWDSTSTLLIFSENVFGNFIYYSHLLPIVCLLLLAGILLWQNPKDNTVRALAFMAMAFTAWSYSDLVLWATARPEHTMFFWSIIIHFEMLIYIGALYFVYHFIEHKGPPLFLEVGLLILYVPLILFAHTSLNLTGFDYTNCYREALEGPLLTYVYIFEIIISLWILGYATRRFFRPDMRQRRKEIMLALFGILAFLFSFSFGNIIGTLEVDWELGQYGLFGAPVFAGLLTYLIVRYRSINSKIFSAQALVIAILILIFSLLFLRNIENVRIVTAITFVLTAVLGALLARSVKREIRQREEIEKLAEKLKQANKRLRELDRQKSEFVSIASHQLRSPLTAIRGYASMMVEGSFGAIPKKAQEAAERIHESSRYMALSIEDFLNVSRIEQGRMKYELSDFNLRDVAEKVVDELRPAGIKKGLVLMFRTECESGCVVNADIGKVRQVLYNLIDNAMKYTPKGSITVIAHDDLKQKKMYVTVHDTGVGMSKETLGAIFEKFVRAKNANSVNVSGTGLGLFVAKQMIEAMGGKITPASDGEGKGSKFTLELPLV